MWGTNMKNQGANRTYDQGQVQKKLKNTNVGKSETSKTEEILKIMNTLKEQQPNAQVKGGDQQITFQSAANNYQQNTRNQLGQRSRNQKLLQATSNFLTADSNSKILAPSPSGQTDQSTPGSRNINLEDSKLHSGKNVFSLSSLEQFESSKRNAQDGKENDFFEDVMKDGDAADRLEMQFINEMRQKTITDRQGAFFVHQTTVYYSKTSLWCFSSENTIRKMIVWLIEWRWFQMFITISILINTISLSAYDYRDRDSFSKRNRTIDLIDSVLSVIFAVEAVLKIFGMGFIIHKYSYMRQGWNIMDFIIAISGIIEFFSFDVNLKAMRILRVIRPLRTIKAFPTIRKQISTLIQALPELANTTLFIMFVVVLVSVLGLQQFQGVMYYRCRTTEKPLNSTYWPKSPIYTRVCSKSKGLGGDYQCPEGLYCGSPLQFGISLKDDGIYEDPQLQFGIANFDNIGQAFIAVFQIFTVEDWSLLMNNLADGYSSSFTKFYFSAIVIIGHFYMLQLLLAVINSNLTKILNQESFYTMTQKEMKLEMQKKQDEFKPDEEINKGDNDNDAESAKDKEAEMDEAQKKAIKDLAKVLRMARAAKAEAQRKIEEEAKKKEAMQSTPMVNLGGLSQAIQKAKEEKKLREEQEKAAKEKKDQVILEEAKKDIIEKERLSLSKADDIVISKQELDRKREELEKIEAERIKQEAIDEKIKNQIMWSVGGAGSGVDQGQDKQGQNENLSHGIGLALLSKALGVNKIEDKFQKHMNRLKKTRLMAKFEARHKIQKKIYNEIGKLGYRSDLDVSKMYWKSKKNVYGIDNELHLVEQVQTCMKILFKSSKNQKISHQDILDIFDLDNETPSNAISERDKPQIENQQEEEGHEDPLKGHIPQLDQHQLLSLKIAYNLKELTYQKNVKQFFFARFKRRLIKKSIIDKIQSKIVKYIIETELLLRAQKNRFLGLSFIVMTSRVFKVSSFIIIVANTVVLGLTQDNESLQTQLILENLNLFFFAFFCFEIVVKLLGEGIRHYIRDRFNWFDGAVVVISAIDITIEYTLRSINQTSNQQSGAITALRVLRLIRVFQLGKLWKDFQQLLKVIMGTLKDVANISFLILVLLYCYLLIGMELFANQLPPPDPRELIDNYHQTNFNSFLESFVSVFIVLANDGWVKLYTVHYRETNQPLLSTFFFISLLIIGQFILLNLFISVLIENFEQVSVKSDLVNKLTDLKKDSSFQRIKKWVFKCVKCKKNQVSLAVNESKMGQEKIEMMIDEKYQDELRMQDLEQFQTPSLFIFKFESFPRQLCLKIIEYQYFEAIMMIFIIISSVQLGIDNPLNDPDSTLTIVLRIIDYVITCIFGLEIFIKIIANGFFFCGSRSYMKNPVNILDIIITLISVLSYSIKSNLNSLKALRTIKLLRPLRTIAVNQNLKIAIQAISIALEDISNVIIVLLLFLFICGIISVNYFKGAFSKCVLYENDIGDMSWLSLRDFLHINDKWQCLNLGLEWENSYLNFDNILESMSTLFVMSNSIGWAEIMYHGSKVRGNDLTANYEDPIKVIPTIFFIVIVTFGNFFLINLFIGVIISKYNRERELAGKDYMLTEEQKKWVKGRMNIIYSQPIFKMKPPRSQWMEPFFYLAESIYLQSFIMICIVINTIILSMSWYGQADSYNTTFDNLNLVFTVIFTLEFLIKVAGYGSRLFTDNWNTFDMIVVLISILGIIMSAKEDSQIGPQTTIIRSFRIVRLLFFFKGNKALRNTLMTFLVSVPAMANIGALLMLVNIIFAILSVYLFAEVKHNGELNEFSNFQTFGAAIMTLIRTLSGEKWPKIMEALSKNYSPSYQCMENPAFEDYYLNKGVPIGCGSIVTARVFFFSYSLIMCTVLMRLFIAIVLQTFGQTTERDNKFMSSELVQSFRQTWSAFDHDATSFIKIDLYPRFLIQLGEPLGWNVSFQHNFLKQMAYLAEISLPKYNTATEYYFLDVLEHLILIMIIRREVINFALKQKHFELVGAIDEKSYFGFDDLIYQLQHQSQDMPPKIQNPEILPPSNQKPDADPDEQETLIQEEIINQSLQENVGSNNVVVEVQNQQNLEIKIDIQSEKNISSRSNSHRSSRRQSQKFEARMVTEGQETMRFSDSPQNSPRKTNYNSVPQIEKLPLKSFPDQNPQVKIEKLSTFAPSYVPQNLSNKLKEQPRMSVNLPSDIISQQDLLDKPLTSKVLNEQLEVVMETSEKVISSKTFEKQNLYSEGISTVRFEVNDKHPSVTTLQLIKHQSLDQELEDLISKEPILGAGIEEEEDQISIENKSLAISAVTISAVQPQKSDKSPSIREQVAGLLNSNRQQQPPLTKQISYNRGSQLSKPELRLRKDSIRSTKNQIKDAIQSQHLQENNIYEEVKYPEEQFLSLNNYANTIEAEFDRNMLLVEEELDTMQTKKDLPLYDIGETKKSRNVDPFKKIQLNQPHTQVQGVNYIVNSLEEDLEKGVRPPPAAASFLTSMSSGGQSKTDKPRKDPKVVKQRQFEAAKETIKNFVQMSSFRGQLNQINAVYGGGSSASKPKQNVYKRPHMD